MNENYDATALLALPRIKEGSAPSAGLLSWSRPYLIEQIRGHGVDVQVSRGFDAFNVTDNTVNRTLRPEYTYDHDSGEVGLSVRKFGAASLDHFGVIRNIIKPIDSDTTTPFLNPNSVRALARDKLDMTHMVLDACGVYGREYESVIPEWYDASIEELCTIPGDYVVAKPVSGKKSEGVLVGKKIDIVSSLSQAKVPYIVEEKLDFSHPMGAVRAINESEQQRLNHANHYGVNKELRLFYFGDGEWDSVLRVAMPGESDFIDDKWLFINQDSVPGTLIENSARVISAIQRLVGPQDSDFNIAIDWVYASSASRPEPSWRVMEVNASEPQLVQLSQNLEVGKRQHDKLATQISRIALR